MRKVQYKEYTLEGAIEQIDKTKLLYFDTETDGFYGKVCLAQFMQEDWTHAILVPHPNHMLLAAFLTNIHLVMQNSHYDITTIQQQTDTRWTPKEWSDTFFAGRLTFPANHSYSLDDLFIYALGIDPYSAQGLDKKTLQKSKWNKLVHSPEEKLYAATDVFFLPDLHKKVILAEEEISYKLDMHATKCALDFQWNGMPVVNDRLQKKYRSNLDVITEYDIPINVNSYKQVRQYIDSTLSDDLGLATLAAEGNERAAAVRVVRGLKKQNSFMDKFDTEDQRIYGKFLPSTRSGRFSSKDQNLQQLPRALKGLFGYTPEDGKCLIYSDYSQLELRCIATITNEGNMANLYRRGEDLHDYTANMLFGDVWTKDERQIAKTCNFNFLYGGSAAVMIQILLKQTGIKLPEAQANVYKNMWKRLWPSVVAWQQRGINDWRNGQLGSTPFGRQYIGNLMTDQLNIENQGFGAEVAKLAMHYMYPRLKELSEEILLCDFIHDSYIIECPLEPVLYEAASTIVAHAMQEAWFEAIKSTKIPNLPMPVNVMVGYNWGDIEEGDFFYEYKLEGMEECVTTS